MSLDSPRLVKVQLEGDVSVVAKRFVISKERKFKEFTKEEMQRFQDSLDALIKRSQEIPDEVKSLDEEDPEDSAKIDELLNEAEELQRKSGDLQEIMYTNLISFACALHFFKTDLQDKFVVTDAAGNPTGLTDEIMDIASWDDLNEISKVCTSNDFLASWQANIEAKMNMMRKQMESQE